MTRLTIDLLALQHNLDVINGWMRSRKATWSVVTKVLCGHPDTIRALQCLGVRSMGDSRLMNLEIIGGEAVDIETWYLRLPHMSVLADVVALAKVSLNSEIRVIEALNAAAKQAGVQHRIIIMIELGDLREGILPGSLVDFYRKVFDLSNIEVLGIGANLGCLAGAVPSVDQFTQLALYRELLELKFKHALPFISAGSSVVLPLTLNGELPRVINHFRIGEALFLGTDLVNGGTLDGLRTDVFLLEAEIAEIKEKSLNPLAEAFATQPFPSKVGNEHPPGERGYRALVTVGQLDTKVEGLIPLVAEYQIAGASSDITVVNLADNPHDLQVGDSITFRPDYAALLGLMSSAYVEKQVQPSIAVLENKIQSTAATQVSAVLPREGTIAALPASGEGAAISDQPHAPQP